MKTVKTAAFLLLALVAFAATSACLSTCFNDPRMRLSCECFHCADLMHRMFAGIQF